MLFRSHWPYKLKQIKIKTVVLVLGFNGLRTTELERRNFKKEKYRVLRKNDHYK